MPRKQKAGWMVPVSTLNPANIQRVTPLLNPNPAQPVSPMQPMAPGQQPMQPMAPGQQPMQSFTGGNLDVFSMAIMYLNNNPYMVGMFMLLLNLGGRFLSLELTKKQEEFLQASWLRPLLFFTVVYIATRNLVAAFWTTLLFFFVIWVAANEHSPFCLIPSWGDTA